MHNILSHDRRHQTLRQWVHLRMVHGLFHRVILSFSGLAAFLLLREGGNLPMLTLPLFVWSWLSFDHLCSICSGSCIIYIYGVRSEVVYFTLASISRMNEAMISPGENRVLFAQLYGMCDHISFALGKFHCYSHWLFRK